ncbi:MAG TPA: ATP-binding protein [Thermoplasmata archaeon]|nr:ATP-binding protein [Thermoplasmata archaeon]
MSGVRRRSALWLATGFLSRRPTVTVSGFDDQTRMLLDLPLGVLLLVDERRVVTFSNHAVVRFLGYQPKEIVGRPLAELFIASSRPGLTNLVENHLPGDPVASGEFRGLRKDGSVIPLQVVVQSAVVAGMRGEKMTGVYLRDFAEREKLVEALAGRAAELARSNRELEQFSYIASHDLQEPLRMVGSYTQLLEQRYAGQLDEDAREFLRYAQEGAARMRELIDALLAYSRIDTRGQAFARVPMSQVLTLTLANLRESIAQGKAEVTVTGTMPEVDGDAIQLGQVLQNLIGNAIKFHGDRPPHIWVGAERKGPDWVFSVRDDGIGIAPEYHERIFVIFQRLHSREEYAGTGIGLSVVKKVIERHGGKIWVESRGVPGEGSTFFFTLPADHRALVRPAAPVTDPLTSQTKAEALNLIEARLKELV